jgi:3',5'-cyclic AMP phosphodiesterase CpdA
MMKNLILFFTAICIASSSPFAQFSFVHISDLHISNTAFPNSDLNAATFRCYLKEFAAIDPKPAFVVASGDISNMGNKPPDGMYPAITQYLFPTTNTNPGIGAYFIDSARTIPVYFTPGNHEYWTAISSQLIPISNDTPAYYSKYVSPDSDYAVTTAIAVVAFLRSGPDVIVSGTNMKGNGLSNEQCAWLRNILSINGGKRKIIVMHHPAVTAAGTTSDGSLVTGAGVSDTSNSCIQNNRTEFLNICDSNRVDVVLCGHKHQNVVANRKGIVISENRPDSTRYVQTAAAFNRSYRIITVDPAFVTVSAPMRSCNSMAGINEVSNAIRIPVNAIKISVFPNPAIDKFTIECNQKAAIEIVTIDGQSIKEITIANVKTAVDLADLPSGIYMVKAKTDKGTAVTRFVVCKSLWRP